MLQLFVIMAIVGDPRMDASFYNTVIPQYPVGISAKGYKNPNNDLASA